MSRTVEVATVAVANGGGGFFAVRQARVTCERTREPVRFRISLFAVRLIKKFACACVCLYINLLQIKGSYARLAPSLDSSSNCEHTCKNHVACRLNPWSTFPLSRTRAHHLIPSLPLSIPPFLPLFARVEM